MGTRAKSTLSILMLTACCCLQSILPIKAADTRPIDPRYDEVYTIKPFDEITFVRKDANGEKSYKVPVLPNGTVTLPGYGEVDVEGYSVKTIKERLMQKKPLKSGEEIDILVAYHQRRHVFVIGQVFKPGSYSIKDMTSIYDAIATAGGFNKVANKRKVKIIRQRRDGTRESYYVNFPKQVFDAYEEGIGPERYQVHEGDIVFVPPMRLKQVSYFLAGVIGLALQASTIGLLGGAIGAAVD